MSINEYVTDKAIEILGLMDQLLRLASGSFTPDDREKMNKLLQKVSSITADIKKEIAQLD